MNRLRELMDIKNITQKQLVLDLGIGQSTISDYMNGKREIKGKNLAILAEYIGVDPMVLKGIAPIPRDLAPYLYENNKMTLSEEDINTIAQRVKSQNAVPELDEKLVGLLITLSSSQVQRVIGYVESLKEFDTK